MKNQNAWFYIVISPKILPTLKQINLCVNFSTLSHRHCLVPLLISGTQLQNSVSAKVTSHYVFDLILLKLVQYNFSLCAYKNAGWVFISDNTSHSNNRVNHYLQQIHEHYDAYYVQNDFGHISVLTVWADNCSEQFKSQYQLGWSVLYINKTTPGSHSSLFLLSPTRERSPWWTWLEL